MSVKRLYLLRHAKTELGTALIQDHERALIERGQHDAAKLGLWMSREGITVDGVLSSSSVRTRQTMEHLSLNWQGYGEVAFSESLYLASVGDMLTMVQSLDDAKSSILVIGHNPGIHQLALTLLAHAKDRDFHEMEMNFPTCALAMMEWDVACAWRDVNPQSARLKAFLTRHSIASALAA